MAVCVARKFPRRPSTRAEFPRFFANRRLSSQAIANATESRKMAEIIGFSPIVRGFARYHGILEVTGSTPVGSTFTTRLPNAFYAYPSLADGAAWNQAKTVNYRNRFSGVRTMLSASPTRTPSYRKHKGSGQAVVTLNGKDHYLGRYGTRHSKDAYDRLICLRCNLGYSRMQHRISRW
jgi:hypothetical protein